jgi:hypothetical protein
MDAAADDELHPVNPIHGAPLLVRTHGSSWVVPSTTSWTNEASLRDLLVTNPTVLPGVADPATVAVKEFPIPGSGRLDVLAVEPSGRITLCEAKLASNAEIRRTVVGQVLAYASGLAGMRFELFDELWTARSGRSILVDVLADEATEDDRSDIRAAITKHLRDGDLRLVLAVDALTDELRRIVEYLSAHTDLDVVALELAYASQGHVEILVPRTWGEELAASGGLAERPRPEGEAVRKSLADVVDAVAGAAELRSSGAGAVVRRVLDAVASRTAYVYLGSPDSLDPVVVVTSPVVCQPIKVITSQKTPGIRVCFHWSTRLSEAKLDATLRRLEQHHVIAPHVAEVRSANYRKGPLLPFAGVLDQEGTTTALIEALAIALDDGQMPDGEELSRVEP